MMNNTRYFRSVLTISLGAIALFFLLQSNINAQTTEKPINITPVTDTPQIQPTVPEPDKPNIPQVVESEIRLVIKRSQRRVYVYQGDILKNSYPVAVGKPGWETPIGTFQVFEMLENPGMVSLSGKEIPPGANNPLGERWIGFWTNQENSIGFHGTPDRASIGKAASHGCIRMYNEHIRQLYEIVKIGTSVTVEP